MQWSVGIEGLEDVSVGGARGPAWARGVFGLVGNLSLFDITTSKNIPKHRYVVYFDLQMCFAQQRRAIFEHLNFKKWSEYSIFYPFLSCKCASRHSGMQFLDI